MSIPLYAPPADAPGVLAAIRASDYLKEVTSGEAAPEDSGLWDLVRVCGDVAGADVAAQETRRLPDGWTRRVFVLADAQTRKDGSVVLGAVSDASVDTLRVAARSVLELVRMC